MVVIHATKQKVNLSPQFCRRIPQKCITTLGKMHVLAAVFHNETKILREFMHAVVLKHMKVLLTCKLTRFPIKQGVQDGRCHPQSSRRDGTTTLYILCTQQLRQSPFNGHTFDVWCRWVEVLSARCITLLLHILCQPYRYNGSLFVTYISECDVV